MTLTISYRKEISAGVILSRPAKKLRPAGLFGSTGRKQIKADSWNQRALYRIPSLYLQVGIFYGDLEN